VRHGLILMKRNIDMDQMTFSSNFFLYAANWLLTYNKHKIVKFFCTSVLHYGLF
jgi:hypothetical protein